MPFIEIKKAQKDFIRIKPDGSITISVSLIHRFNNESNGGLVNVKVFYDKENKKIGFKPDEDGYKITDTNKSFRIKCIPLSRIVTGEFYPEWSEKQKMLVVSYE